MQSDSHGNEKPEKAKKTASKPEKTRPEEPLIYVGPNIQRGRLKQYTVFRDGVPAYLAGVIAEFPDAQNLIVPVSELATVKKRVNTPGTLEHKTFRELKGAAD